MGSGDPDDIEDDRDPWLTEEDHRILAMAKERFNEAFDVVFGGENDTTS